MKAGVGPQLGEGKGAQGEQVPRPGGFGENRGRIGGRTLVENRLGVQSEKDFYRTGGWRRVSVKRLNELEGSLKRGGEEGGGRWELRETESSSGKSRSFDHLGENQGNNRRQLVRQEEKRGGEGDL